MAYPGATHEIHDAMRKTARFRPGAGTCNRHSEQPFLDRAYFTYRLLQCKHSAAATPLNILCGRGRVKRPDSSTIAGLYAAGGTAGGLEGGGGALGYAGGLIKSCVFGLRTAEHAAASAQLR